jgi:hypothetical protein
MFHHLIVKMWAAKGAAVGGFGSAQTTKRRI